MNQYDSETSNDYMINIDLDAFNWLAGLRFNEEFEIRSNYQKDFIDKQYSKLYAKLKGKYKR